MEVMIIFMNEYIKDLFNAIRNTTIEFEDNISANSERMITNYEKGIDTLINLFKHFKNEGSRLYFIGNGGSAAISSHMTTDFMKNGGMNTISLYDNAVITCFGNDYGYEYIFSKPISLLADSGDVLIVISSSGNSMNLVNAIRAMKEKGGMVITFTGFNKNNKCRSLGDINIHVPCQEYGKVESIHQLILQQIVDIIMKEDGVEL